MFPTQHGNRPRQMKKREAQKQDSGSEPVGDRAKPTKTTVVFLYDNDTHWNLNYLEAFREKIKSYRERYENVFLLYAGDMFIRHRHRWPEDTMAYYEERSAFMVDTMNTLGYDAATLGNHELYYYGTVTRRVLERAEFPLLVANVDIKTDRLPVTIRPHLILETGAGHRVAVVGLSEIPDLEGLHRLDLFETARVQAEELREKADILVALTHISYPRDRELASKVPEYDLIIGGHSHTPMEKTEVVNSVQIAQAGGVPGHLPVDGSLPKYLGRVKLILENEHLVERDTKLYCFGD